MTFPPETLVQIQNNFTEMFLMVPSTKVAQMSLLCRKRGWQSYRLVIFPQIKIISQKCSSCCPLLKLILRFSLATRAKNRNIFKSNLLSHRPIHHLLVCLDSGEWSRAIGPSCLIILPFNYTGSFYLTYIWNRSIIHLLSDVSKWGVDISILWIVDLSVWLSVCHISH